MIGGHTDTRFAAVRDVFAQLFDSGADTGAALAVIHEGRPVVEVHGGWQDAGHRRPWAPDTTCCWSARCGGHSACNSRTTAVGAWAAAAGTPIRPVATPSRT
ncbi:beta-lactamase family protein [Planosporangium flavigriseum]|nr:beta-lactamase family protein [Planosporangium flavigriseum]